ncbi:hypothetical protein NECAME_09000 [Necator americanus]|uniref:Uncharacterized protein n=1 Tax=Necator americanus TaxID=51031 RepID=W2TFV8_NECAM|nr:hypothetical protein NECAME_09000 [Necator americanus]ETN80718.1 hypothetical protein NECAME_09000 [Necator americanus]
MHRFSTDPMAALASFTRNNRNYGQQPIDSVVNPQRERNGLDAKASQVGPSLKDDSPHFTRLPLKRTCISTYYID